MVSFSNYTYEPSLGSRAGAGKPLVEDADNSIIQGLEFKTDQILGEIAALHGLALEAIHCLREKRVGASITQSVVRRGEISRSTLYESAVILRKP